MMSISLRKETRRILQKDCQELFNTKKNFWIFLRDKTKSPFSILWIFPLMSLSFLFAAFFEEFALFEISRDTARNLIDQRISNLATIFSLTLVVIGWQFTNLSLKDPFAFKVLFNQSYLYPIFYYIASLLTCLMIGSLFKDYYQLNLGNVMMLATILLVVGLGLITFVFLSVVRIVDTSFFYDGLEANAIIESKRELKLELLKSKSRDIYRNLVTELQFSSGYNFFFSIDNFQSVLLRNVNQSENLKNPAQLQAWLEHSDLYQIKDVNISQLRKTFKPLIISKPNNYKPIYVGMVIESDYRIFDIPVDLDLPLNFVPSVQKCYTLKKHNNKRPSQKNVYRSELYKRLTNAVKENKADQVKRILETYTRLFDIDNNYSSLI